MSKNSKRERLDREALKRHTALRAQYKLNLLIDAVKEGTFSQIELDYWLWWGKEWHWKRRASDPMRSTEAYLSRQITRHEELEKAGYDFDEDKAYGEVLALLVAEGTKTREQADAAILKNRQQEEPPDVRSTAAPYADRIRLTWFEELWWQPSVGGFPGPILKPKYTFEEWKERHRIFEDPDWLERFNKKRFAG
jgi:hypothetical protein